ncbi:hypothetical protein [Candidatus Sororendozoicomonas aggregata]|uniref:hypothetical protein n=1 Tax=Candidatus Sororendozoicomonas aggregata TaxID=3073239 RepID=UPI002ED06C1F
MKKYITCLLLGCLFFLSRATMAKEYEVTISVNSSENMAPISVVPQDTHCLLAKTGRVSFKDHVAKSKVDTSEDLIASCALEHSDAVYYAVDTKGYPQVIFEFYKPKGAKPYLIPIMVSQHLSCTIDSSHLKIACSNV